MSELRTTDFSYLEFGSINHKTGERRSYDFRTDEQAYEWLMFARYSNDIFTYQKMLTDLENGRLRSAAATFQRSIHHKDDFVFNFNKFVGLSLTGQSFFELGQTLFGCIDGMEVCAKLIRQVLPEYIQECELAEVEWYGVDISEFFNHFAKEVHAGYQVNTSTEFEHMPCKYDVVFAKGITLLYAIDDAQKLFDFMMRGKMAILDYSFSVNDAIMTQIGTGKGVNYLSLKQFKQCYQDILSTGKDIWVRGNADLHADLQHFYFEGVVTNDDLAFQFIERQTHWIETLKSTNPQMYKNLIHDKSEAYWRWYRLSEVLDEKLSCRGE